MDEDRADPVEKALRKARESRSEDSRRVTSPADGAASPQRTSSEEPPPAPPARIDYTQTRVQPVPKEKLSANRLVAGAMKDGLADTYRMLRAQVLKRLEAIGGSTIAICSANPGEGKTLTASNLAISTALEPNHTVLLVDLDLRRPRMQEYFEIEVENGLCDYLEGNTELSDVLVNPGINGLTLLPVRRPLLNSSELLSSARMKHLMAEMKGRYPDRIVIYDLPPLLATDDSMVVLPHTDATLLVVREGGTKAGEIQRAMQVLESHNLVGTVLNESKELNLHPYY